MPTIMDALSQQSGQAGQLAGQAGTGTTGRLQQILQQTSGKQASPGDAPTQNFGEQAAVAGAQTQAKQAAGSQALGTASLANADAAQTSQARQAQAATTQTVSADNQRYVNQADQLLQQYETGTRQLGVEQDQAGAAQLSFNMRLSNQEYTTRLAQEGQLRRLNDSTSFQEQTAESVMGSELQTLGDKLNWETAMQANQDQWNQDLQNIDLGSWMQMAQIKAQTENTAATAKGAASLGTGGALAYANYNPSAPTQTPDTSGDAAVSSANPNAPTIT